MAKPKIELRPYEPERDGMGWFVGDKWIPRDISGVGPSPHHLGEAMYAAGLADGAKQGEAKPHPAGSPYKERNTGKQCEVLGDFGGGISHHVWFDKLNVGTLIHALNHAFRSGYDLCASRPSAGEGEK